jgi:hypothetical protein
MDIDLSAPIVRVSAAVAAATLFFGSLTYGVCKHRKCKKLEKELKDLKKVLDEADGTLKKTEISN